MLLLRLILLRFFLIVALLFVVVVVLFLVVGRVVWSVAFGHVLIAVLVTISIAVVLAVVREGVTKWLERLDLLFYFILLVLGKEAVRRELLRPETATWTDLRETETYL